MTMTWETIATIVVALIVVCGVIYWLVRSEKKEAHHLDGLHISAADKEKK